MKRIVTVLLAVMTMLALLASALVTVGAEYDTETGITSILLFDCDVKPDGSNVLSLDKNDKTQGEASLSFQVGTRAVNVMKLPQEVDGSDLDTLEFDLYVSDVSLFDLFGVQGQMDSGLEITSSGASDNQEISWTLAQIKSNNQGDELKAGWNHVILPLNSGRADGGSDPSLQGPFDISAVNFIRFYMVGETTSYNITVKIDNICLSDWNAVTTAAKREAAAKKKAEEFIADVEAVEVTAENYTTVKKDVEDLRVRYEKLNDIAKDYVTKAAKDKLAALEAKIAEFEANPPSADTGNDNTGNNTNTDNDATTGETPASGCGAVAMLGGVAILALAGAMMLRKKEN